MMWLLVGIIKQGKPEFSEIESLKQQQPTKTGIWISGNSRAKFLELLEVETNSKYKIDEEGYLQIGDKNSQNEIDKKIETLISGDKQFIIDMSGTDYTIDTVTGEIIEYPFEQLDAYQAFDYISNDKSAIIVITTNKEKVLTNSEILNSIIAQMSNI